MKIIDFIPECFGVEGAIFEGTLKIAKPSIEDLFEGSKIAKSSAEDELKATRDLLTWSKGFYREVNVKNTVDQSEYKSFDDLLADAECLEILQDVAVSLVSGLNKKKFKNMKV